MPAMDVQQSTWRSTPSPGPRKKAVLRDQLGLDTSTLSKIADGHRERKRRPLATTVADLRGRRRCAVQLVPQSAYFIQPDPYTMEWSEADRELPTALAEIVAAPV